MMGFARSDNGGSDCVEKWVLHHDSHWPARISLVSLYLGGSWLTAPLGKLFDCRT
jgi:hypothetical protein